ncbi:MAG: flagellar protein FlaG [Gammaproteobacteria bacterium]|nr:flagellar protein FlaG [Gammaproteobacteria bacterium]
MMNDISQNLLGTVNAQPKGVAGKAGRVEAAPAATMVSLVASKQTPEPSAEEPEATKPREVSDEQLSEMVKSLNGYAQTVHRQLKFSVDEDNGKVIVKVVDVETQDIIREIPSEEIRNMQKQLGELSNKLFQRNEGESPSLLFQGKA